MTAITIRATHRVRTEGHPVSYACTEAVAERVAEQRLPRTSLIEVHSRHAVSGAESWDFLRPYP